MSRGPLGYSAKIRLFRALCHQIWEIVQDRFPEACHSAIGSFIFLRFFCPAIVNPEAVELDVSADAREIRRALLMITKVIQNLANNVKFKESHMQILNDFLAANIKQVTRYLGDIAVSAIASTSPDDRRLDREAESLPQLSRLGPTRPTQLRTRTRAMTSCKYKASAREDPENCTSGVCSARETRIAGRGEARVWGRSDQMGWRSRRRGRISLRLAMVLMADTDSSSNVTDNSNRSWQRCHLPIDDPSRLALLAQISMETRLLSCCLT